MGGCDKTTPALLMGAASMNLPAIFVPAGPMLRGNWRGKSLGSGSDTWKYWAELKVGNITRKDWEEIEDGIARTPGTCMTMGTAATMMSAVEALGMSLPGSSAIPAADSNHARMASQSGRRIVEMVWEDQKPSDVMTETAFENAIMTVMAIGGSTNAAIHLLAMAGRLGVPIDLDRFDALSRRTPWLADIRPSGRFLMEDFYYAGGLIVGMGWVDKQPSEGVTETAFENAIMTVMAIGGSTNAAIQLLAMAGRLGVPIDLDRCDALSRRTPWLADIRPSGRFLMEDFDYAGGLPALLGELQEQLHLGAVKVSGRTLGEDIERATVHNQQFIPPPAAPLSPAGGRDGSASRSTSTASTRCRGGRRGWPTSGRRGGS